MRYKTGMLIPALVMIACLFFLTGANFFIYPQHMVSKQQVAARSGNDPQGPVEEKPASATGLSIQEEYVHETHTIKQGSFSIRRLPYKFPASEALQEVHSDLTTPPPKSA